MNIRVLDPTNEAHAPLGKPAPRLASLQGKTIGLISNGKEGTVGYFAHLNDLLRQRYDVGEVILRTKTNYSAPADPHIVAEISGWDAVISGIGD